MFLELGVILGKAVGQQCLGGKVVELVLSGEAAEQVLGGARTHPGKQDHGGVPGNRQSY